MSTLIRGTLTNAGTMQVAGEENRTGLFIDMTKEALRTVPSLPMYREVTVTDGDECEKLKKELAAANDILAKLQDLHGCSREMVVYWCAHAAERSLGLAQCQVESAKGQARMHQLRKDVQFVIDHAGKTHDTECGALRCNELWMAEQLGFALDVTEPAP